MKKLTIVRGMLASVIGVLLLCVSISAVPTPTQFELEGNAVVNTPPADDWANTVPTKTASSEAIVSTFVADGSGNKTIFTTGGSKDINDMDQWTWKDQLGGLPDKNNITNAYAAAYIDNGNLVIYFGADRFANDGDAQMGFWFFQDRVQAVIPPGSNTGIFVGPDGVTPAVHSVGDILVLANLLNGGAVVQIQVFKWVGGSDPLLLLADDAQARCGVNTDPNVCAISNDAPETAPWPYTPKQGPAGTFPTFSFIEGGIILSAFTGGSSECFSSFMAETRSSQSEDATLKDFALGDFNTCTIQIAKTCPSAVFNPVTGQIDYTAIITVTNNNPFGTLFDIEVTDTVAAIGHSSTFTLASLAAGISHDFQDTFSITPSTTAPNPPTNTATVKAAASVGGPQTITAGPVSATCPKVEFDANLTITKECTARVEVEGNRVVVVIDISGEVCNRLDPTNPNDIPSPIDNVTVTDTPPFNEEPISLGTLLTDECKSYTATYFPSTVSGTGVPGEQTYEDTVRVTGKRRFDNVDKMNTATDTCPLCPPETH